jgi:hypothetical protein
LSKAALLGAFERETDMATKDSFARAIAAINDRITDQYP